MLHIQRTSAAQARDAEFARHGLSLRVPCGLRRRRQVVCRCKHLTALDHQPIAPQERAYAEAWWRRQQQHHGDDAGQSASSLPPTPTAADGGAVPSPWQAQAPTGTAAPPAPADFLSPPACAASAAALEGVAAAAAAPTLAEGQQPQQHQAVDVLTGVLRCLPLDSLVCAALACRTWAFAALPVLLAARRRKAQVRAAWLTLAHTRGGVGTRGPRLQQREESASLCSSVCVHVAAGSRGRRRGRGGAAVSDAARAAAPRLQRAAGDPPPAQRAAAAGARAGRAVAQGKSDAATLHWQW